MGRGRRPDPASHRATTWARVNAYTGYVLLGIPAVAIVPALAATIARFGAWRAVTGTALSVLAALAPLVAWVVYTRRRPTSGRAVAAWLVIAVVLVAVVWSSPLFFWAGPAACVVASELTRAGLERARGTRRAHLAGSDR